MAIGNTVTVSALRRQLWAKSLFASVSKELYLEKFIDRVGVTEIGLRSETSPEGIVQEITDLAAQKGNQITFGLATNASGNGVDGDGELEGQEEQQSTYSQALTINQKRNAHRLTGEMDEKKAAYNMRKSARLSLKIWLAQIVQQDGFIKLTGDSAGAGQNNASLYNFANTPTAPSTNRRGYAGGQTAESDLTTSHVFDTKVIVKARQLAQLASVKVRPIMVEGRKVYLMLLHPYQSADLKKDAVWNQAQRDAWYRGSKNPIFTGSLGVYDQVVLHEHEDMWIDTDGGSASASIGRAVLCGAQALILAYGRPSKWVEKSFNYDNQWGIACGRIWGWVRPTFNSEDYGTITMSTAAAVASTA